MPEGVRVNICRPGFGASCALCCGSHNYRACREEIGGLFSGRRDLLSDYNKEYLVREMTAGRSNLTGSYYFKPAREAFTLTLPPLFGYCPHCPFVGYRDGGSIVGCLLYPEEQPPGLPQECFQSYRGKIFSCRAREVLSDDEVLYAARLTGDWFYYSVLIHDEAKLRRLAQRWPVPDDVPEDERERMREELEKRIAGDRSMHAVQSYFS